LEASNACPHCFTKIAEASTDTNNKPEKLHSMPYGLKEYQISNKEESLTCKYHLGYLGELEKNQQIPDDCFFCTDLVECKRKK